MEPTLLHRPAIASESFICWKSVLSGVVVSSLAYLIFASLGAGIGGVTASHIIEKGGNAAGLATGAGLWLGGSAILAVFLGSYFATRFSDATHKQVGASRGIVIAAVFFYILINFAGSSLGSFSDVASNFTHTNAVSDADAAAKAIGDAGWLIFVTLLFGVVAAVVGGIEGTSGNTKRPFRISAK